MKRKSLIFSMFQLLAVNNVFAEETAESVSLFGKGNMPVFIAVIVLSAIIVYFIEKAKKGHEIFIRKIAGLNAIDDAVGRATEMGKPVLYVPGIQPLDDLQTLASLSIMGHIAKKTAEYETDLFVPNKDPLVFSTAQEVVKESYLAVGRPDAYNDSMVEFLTQDQFGFVAGVNGYMVREEPASNFYLGGFYAESLILAETGNSVGSIQVAGTAIPSQLPFFITACDYTLIGEELYAAGAYLSTDPKAKGSLKGQDMGKLAVMIMIILIGLIHLVYNVAGQPAADTSFIGKLFEFFNHGLK